MTGQRLAGKAALITGSDSGIGQRVESFGGVLTPDLTRLGMGLDLKRADAKHFQQAA